MMIIPQYIKELLDSGELAININPLPNEPRDTFCLFERIGSEDVEQRDIRKTTMLAQSVCAWVKTNQIQSKIDKEVRQMWYKEGLTYIKIQYILIYLTNPISQLFKDYIDTLDNEDKLIHPYFLLPESTLKLTNTIRLFQENNVPVNYFENKTCYFRADFENSWHSRSYLSGERSNELFLDEVKQVADSIIFRTFPNGLVEMEEFLLSQEAEKMSKDEYNMYYESDHYLFWIRFITRPRDYNIYVNCYNKDEAEKEGIE